MMAFGGVGVIWYIYMLIQFLQEYLRVVIVSPDALIIMHRDGLMEYNIQQIERETIESISYKQDSLRDSILMAGDIVVSFEHLDSYVIHTVYKPKYIAQELFLAKKKYEKHTPTPVDYAVQDHVSDEKFGLLVETLGEVIKDYMGRKI
jgi:hypothetical protein